jgi:hypothetical protein
VMRVFLFVFWMLHSFYDPEGDVLTVRLSLTVSKQVKWLKNFGEGHGNPVGVI